MRSLFWKIFLWFWLSMTLVIAATAFVSLTVRNTGDNAPQNARTARWRVVANASFTQWAQAQAAAWERGTLPKKTSSDDIVSWLLDDDAAYNLQQNTEWWLLTTQGTPLFHGNAEASSSSSKTLSGDVQKLARKAARSSVVVASRPDALSIPPLETASEAPNLSREEASRNENTVSQSAFRDEPIPEELLASSTRTPTGRTVVFVARLPFPGAASRPPADDAARRAFPLAFFFLHGEPLTRTLRLLTMLLTTSLFCFWLARTLTRPVMQLRNAANQLEGGHLEARVAAKLTRRRDEMGELGRDFNAMATRLEALMTAQRRLISDVSHELRSPLARLGIALELARRHSSQNLAGQNLTGQNLAPLDSSTRSSVETPPVSATVSHDVSANASMNVSAPPDAQLQSALNRIEREAGRLEDMVAQLLMLSRLESGAPVGAWETFDLLDVVREIAVDGRFEAQLQRCEVEIVQSDAPDDSAQSQRFAIRGSRALMCSGLENVLRNAIRFSPPGANVQIEVSRQGADARASTKTSAKTASKKSVESQNAFSSEAQAQPQAHIVIRVLDSGPGVPEDVLEKLFQPFYRVEDARDRQSGGTGLGLAIAERAVHLHDGTIRAFNRATGGLCVEITLPQKL